MREEAKKLLEKAQRALRAADILMREGEAEPAVGHAYYAMLHTAQALLRERDLRYHKHSGVHAAYGEHFARPALLDPKFHRWMLAAFNNRLKGDYDFDAVIDSDTATTTIRQAQEFLQEANRFLAAPET